MYKIKKRKKKRKKGDYLKKKKSLQKGDVRFFSLSEYHLHIMHDR